MPVMPFLSRRRSALDVLTANTRIDNDDNSQRPHTSNLAIPTPSTRPARPISVHGTAFASSRLSHEVRREDIPDSPIYASEKRRSKRFSMLKMRNFSESHLSFSSQADADNDIPPMPALPPQGPPIIRTAPTTDMSDAASAQSRSSSRRPVSRKRGSDGPMTAPRKSIDEKDRPKKSSLRWRKRQSKSTALEGLMAISDKQVDGVEEHADLAVPGTRFSESSRSDVSRLSSGDHTANSNFFRIPRRNKNRNSLFPLPIKLPTPTEVIKQGPTTPNASMNGRRSVDTRSPPLTSLHHRGSSGSPSKRNTILAPQPSKVQSPLTFALQTGQDLVRRTSQRSRNSSTSSPLQPPTRLGLRDSTSTTGRSSLAGFLSLSRFRQDSDANSPGTRSKSNSFALSREALVIPEREEGDTPGKYLEKLEATVSRSMIATILSQSSDSFSQAVLRSYTRRFPFFGEPIDMSLRKFLLEADLPKETQQVDRVIQAFADRYHECNPGIFMNPDQAYIIAFSLMMLHTDAFNKNNKRKMQKQDYIKNTSGQRVSDEVLGCLYDNICYTPFVHYEEEANVNGERVLTSKPKKAKLKVPANDATKKPSGPVDPYNLLIEQKLDTLRPSIRDSITMEDPYSYFSGQASLDMKSLQRAFNHTGVLQIISARSRPTAYESHFNNANTAAGETEAGIINIKITKVGTLWRKATKKKKARSPWQEWGAVLTGSQLYLFKNAHWAKGLAHQFVTAQRPGSARIPVTFKPPLQDFKPDGLIKTDDAVALVDSTYTRHKHAFTFVRHGGQEEVFLADNDVERNDWLALINYAAAFRAAGVRIRGMLGVNDDDARNSRRASATSNVSTDDGRNKKLDAQLTKQVMAARQQTMLQQIVEADRDVANMTRQLEDMMRDARHLLVLAPIAAKTRDDVMFAAAKADAKLKWIRRDIWRVRSHRDIIALDVQEDGVTTTELQTMVAKLAAVTAEESDAVPTLKSQQSPQRRPMGAITTLSRDASVREAADQFVEDVFRTPLESTKAGQAGDGWRLPPLQLDVTDQDRQQRDSTSSAMLSVPAVQASPASARRASVSQTSTASQGENLATPAPIVRAVTPTPSAVDTDTDVQTTLSTVSDALPSLDGTKTNSPESTSKQRSVRRSLQKTLREVQHHQPSIRGHRRGKESESTVRSGGDAHEEEEGTPGLERAKGRFILHGKQASVIEFGGDWPNEKMKMRRDAWRGAARESKPRKRAIEDGRQSPVVQELIHDQTDDDDTEDTISSAARSFVESAGLADQYAATGIEEESDEEQQFYDLSSWDPDTGRRSMTIGASLAGLQDEPESEEDEAVVIKHEQDHDLPTKGDRRTVIGPSARPTTPILEGNDDWLTKSFEHTAVKRAAVA